METAELAQPPCDRGLASEISMLDLFG